jgi:hypothetical protein
VKKPGPEWGPASVFAGVGAGNIFQRGTSCPPVILGGYASGATANAQYAPSALSINVGGRMPAMRNRKSFDGKRFAGRLIFASRNTLC